MAAVGGQALRADHHRQHISHPAGVVADLRLHHRARQLQLLRAAGGQGGWVRCDPLGWCPVQNPCESDVYVVEGSGVNFGNDTKIEQGTTEGASGSLQASVAICSSRIMKYRGPTVCLIVLDAHQRLLLLSDFLWRHDPCWETYMKD